MLLQTLVAFGAVGLLALILRLFFGPGRDTTMIAFRSPDEPDDFGLLTPAASLDSAVDAEAFRSLLRNAGIKATVTRAQDGRFHVLVFPSELDRARRVGGAP
jgi:hypothetical protein